MKYILRRRPSPAFVIACIALFVALGGVSYGLASGSIDSREIKNNDVRSKDVRNNTLRTFDIRNNEVRGFDIRNSTVQGRDVALNTLTGADISEKDLGKVPSAGTADTATTATNATTAGTVGGISVRKFFAKPAPGTAATEVLRGDGFIVAAGCAGNGDAVLRLDPIAGAPATNVGVAGNGNAAAFTTNVASIGAGVSLLGGNASATGTATLSTTGGAVATIAYAAQAAPAFTGENVCALRGTVTSG